jgi:tetratricopeptide (TPR) repeat protein
MAKTYDKWTAEGARHVAGRNFVRGRRAFTEAIAISGGSPEDFAQLGYCNKMLGNLDEAEVAYARALEHSDERTDWHLGLARVLSEKGDRERSAFHYEKGWKGQANGHLAIELSLMQWPQGLAFFANNLPSSQEGTLARLDAIARDPSTGSEQEATQLIDLLSQSCRQPATFWLYLYSDLMISSRATAALKAKRIAAEEILRTATQLDSIRHLENAMAAACYLDNFVAASDLIAQFRMTHEPEGKWTDSRSEIDLLLCQGKVKEARAIFFSTPVSKSPNSQAYREFLSSKTVALVGPAKNELGNGAEIDAHDLVVRTNFSGQSIIEANGAMIGRRSGDIVYYNSPFIYGLGEQVLEGLRAHPPQFVVGRSRGMKRLLTRSVPGIRIRNWLSYKKSDFIGVSFAMRHLVFELMLFVDKPVSVYGADFFLGAATHYPGYFDPGIEVTRAWAQHDPFDTFTFLKAMWQVGTIVPDKILGDILNLSIEEFAKRLSQRFGG